MDDKYRLIFAAHEIMTTQQGATAMPCIGEAVQSSKGGGSRDWHNWAISMSIVGDLAGGWSYLVNAYLSDERFNFRQRESARTFWRLVRKRKGLFANGIYIAELMGIE